MKWWPLLLVGCERPEPAQPTRPSPVEAVSVAPHSTGSPNEPTLLLGPQKPIDSAAVERVKVKDEAPDASFLPPRDRCPDGVTEMIAVHLALGESMEIAQGASPVAALASALGGSEAIDVVYDRTRKIVRVTAKKYGLVFVLTERDHRCTWYGVNSGY